MQKTYASVLQYPLLKTVLIVIEIATQYYGDYCIGNFSPKHAHLYLFLADLLFVGGALGATMKFTQRFKGQYQNVAERRIKAKIWTFLGIIFFQIIQDFLFGLLNGKVFKPSLKATYNDINFGVASFLTCIESVFFSLIMHWSYSSKEYHEGSKMDRFGMAPNQRTPTSRAIFSALNLSDIVAGTMTAMKLLLLQIVSRVSGTGQRQSSMHLEPLTRRRGMRDETGRQSPDDFETGYTAGYHAPPAPPMARDPSPGRMMGRQQYYGADELRPEYSRSYNSRSSGDEEGLPLQQSRSIV